MENETNGKEKLLFVCCKWKTETQTSVCLLQKENGNSKLPFLSCKRKQKFVFLGLQSINGNRRLLFQQMCPSMHLHLFIFNSAGMCFGQIQLFLLSMALQ
jgi:hypothetical protein